MLCCENDQTWDQFEFPAFCWCVICFVSLGTCGAKSGPRGFLSNIIFLVMALTVSLQVLNINSYTPFHPCMLMFLSSVTSAQVRTGTQYLLTFYLQLSHIFGSDTWLLHTWAHVSILFSFNHPCQLHNSVLPPLASPPGHNRGLERQRTSESWEPSQYQIEQQSDPAQIGKARLGKVQIWLAYLWQVWPGYW